MSSIPELIPQSKRNDAVTRHKRQAAANTLHVYSLLAQQALKNEESFANTRLKMMRSLTDLPELPKEAFSNNRKKSSIPSTPTASSHTSNQ